MEISRQGFDVEDRAAYARSYSDFNQDPNCCKSDYKAYWLTRNQSILNWLLYERSSIICLQVLCCLIPVVPFFYFLSVMGFNWLLQCVFYLLQSVRFVVVFCYMCSVCCCVLLYNN